MDTVQLSLYGGNRGISDITLDYSEDGKKIIVSLGLSLLGTVPNDPGSLPYKLLVGSLYLIGFRPAHLKQVFGHDQRTIKEWGRAAMLDDPDEAARIFAGRRGGAKVTLAVFNFVRMLYQECRLRMKNFRQYIGERVEEIFGVTLSGESLRRMFREIDGAASAGGGGTITVEAVAVSENDAGESGGTETAAVASVSGGTSPEPFGAAAESSLARVAETHGDWSMSCASPVFLSSTAEPPRNRSTNFSSPTMPFSGMAVPTVRTAFHHAGAVLALPLLDLLSGDDRHDLSVQLVAQVLQGAVNIEQGKRLTLPDLSLFTGTFLSPGTPQRHALRKLAGTDFARDAYRRNLNLLGGAATVGDTFYLDPHTKEYTGMLDIIKGWCGSKHGVGKALHMDTIHTRAGNPCFIVHYDSYDDLRVRIFVTVGKFREMNPHLRDRFITFVIDRGIYGLACFKLLKESKCRLITWEKGYGRGGGWNDSLSVTKFTAQRLRNGLKDRRDYRFECVEYPWGRDESVRRIIVRAAGPGGETIEVSVLCTHPDMPLKEAVLLIFNRWLQENGFRLLELYVGIGQLDSRASTAYAELAKRQNDGKKVANPAYVKAKRALSAAEMRHGKALLTLARLQKLEAGQLGKPGAPAPEQDGKPPRPDALKRKIEAAEKAVADAGAESEAREAEMADLIRSLPKLQHLADNGHVRLDTRRKACFDALRVAAMNIILSLLAAFRTVYDNRRDDLTILYTLLNGDGFICYDGNFIRIELWLKGHYQPNVIGSIIRFLDKISMIVSNRFPGHPPLKITLTDNRYLSRTPIPLPQANKTNPLEN